MIIKTRKQHNEALGEVEVLMNLDPEANSEEGKRLVELADAIVPYEKDMIQDHELMDFLESLLGQYTGKVILRMSEHGRGMRLHETSREGGHTNLRDAIIEFKKEYEKR